MLINDAFPRAINPDKTVKNSNDWECGKIVVEEGASLGAGTIILPNIVVGRYAMVGAGSVVTKNIPDFALAYGNPAKVEGYVCKCGSKIVRECKKCSTVVK